MVMNAFNSSTHRGRRNSELEASLVYISEFQDSKDYIERPCLKNNNKQTNKQNNKYSLPPSTADVGLKGFPVGIGARNFH